MSFSINGILLSRRFCFLKLEIESKYKNIGKSSISLMIFICFFNADRFGNYSYGVKDKQEISLMIAFWIEKLFKI